MFFISIFLVSSNSATSFISALSRDWQHSVASLHQYFASLNSCFFLMELVDFNSRLNLTDPGILIEDGCREAAPALILSILFQCLVCLGNMLFSISAIGFGSDERDERVAFFEISFGLVIVVVAVC